MDTKSKNKTIEEASRAKIPKTDEATIKALRKVAQYTTSRYYQLKDLNPYLYFLIETTPGWAEEYFPDLYAISLLMQESNSLLVDYESNPQKMAEWQITIPNWVFELAASLPEFPVEENSSFKDLIPKITKELSYGNNEYITAHVLDVLKSQNKIDEDFWSQAFDHCREKKVVEKFLKDKVNSGTPSDKYVNKIYKKLISYIGRTTFRLRKSQDKKLPKILELDRPIGPEKSHWGNLLPDDSSIYNLYEFLENESLKEQLNLLVETSLTEREREVIPLKYEANLNQEEIAKKLKISQPKVGEHLGKGHQKLSKGLRKPHRNL